MPIRVEDDQSMRQVFDSACRNNSKDVVSYYDNWAHKYDQDAVTASYRGPEIVTSYVQQWLKDKDARIMDICAGTGAGAIELRKAGYCNLDALDGSEAMLQVAKDKNLYRNYYCEFLNGDKPTTADAGSYDAVIVIGSFLGGHLLPEVNQEFLRLLKPGGYCIIGNRYKWLLDIAEYKDKLEPYMLNMQGWTLQHRQFVPNWFEQLDGIVWVFQKK